MPQFLGGLVAVLLIAAAAGAATAQTSSGLDRHLATIYEAAYSLDQNQAIAAARDGVKTWPNESRSHRALAAALWLDIIFRRGTVTVDHYVGGLGGPVRELPKPSPAIVDEFTRAVNRAIELADARVKANPDDVQARFELGSAHALQASYLASVDGSLSSAFMAARHAFNAQEEVLARDSKRAAAGVVVGTYRYMVSGLALPTRMFAYMVGFGGGKAEGIKLLETAARDSEAQVEAKTALILIYSRERRHADVYRLLGELAAAFPRNRLFVLEQGSAAIRAGKHAEAEAILTAGLSALDRDPRPRMPGERALWLYKRGLARFHRNHRAAAAVDLEESLRSLPAPWVRGRALLTLGKVHDLEGRRNQAVERYRTAREAATSARDRAATREAARLLSRPYQRSG